MSVSKVRKARPERSEGNAQGENVEPILQTLEDLNIHYEIQEHKPIFSEKDSEDVVITLPGIDVKNLFLKDKHNNYGLVSMNLHKRAFLFSLL